MSIHFGTSGRRAAIADEFTFAQARTVTTGTPGAYGTHRRRSGLAVEAVAVRGASLTEQLDALYARVGRLEDARIGVRITPQLLASLNDKLDREQNDIGGRRVERTNRMDGCQVHFRGRFLVADALFCHRTTRSHLRRIRISKGLGGAS